MSWDILIDRCLGNAGSCFSRKSVAENNIWGCDIKGYYGNAVLSITTARALLSSVQHNVTGAIARTWFGSNHLINGNETTFPITCPSSQAETNPQETIHFCVGNYTRIAALTGLSSPTSNRLLLIKTCRVYLVEQRLASVIANSRVPGDRKSPLFRLQLQTLQAARDKSWRGSMHHDYCTR